MFESPISIAGVMASHYVVQGYYGMSLSLTEGFDSTLGFGHSPFLLRQISRFVGDDFARRTFQKKIDNQWATGVRWHSAFSQFANDVGFAGVTAVLFIIFLVFGLHWGIVLKYRDPLILCFMPVHLVLIIFLPANNQIFGFGDTFGLSVLMLCYTIFCFLNQSDKGVNRFG